MRFFKKKLKKGDPWSKDGMTAGIQGMADAWAGAKIRNGRISWSGNGIPTFIFNKDLDFMETPTVWGVSFAGSAGSTTATFSNCFFKRDSFTLRGGSWPDYEIDYAMPSTPTTLYVGFQYNTETGAVTIISGATFAEVSEQSVPTTNVELVKTPLYIMVLSDDIWGVNTNLFVMPVVGLSN